MANHIYSASFAIPSAYVASSTFGGFNNADIGDYMHPYRQWRSGSTLISGTDYVGIDLGAATTIKAVVVVNVNLAGNNVIKVQSSAASNFSSPTTDLTVTVNTDLTSGRNKLFQLINSGTGTSAQYWRILANTATTTDGGPAMRCGSIALLTAYNTITTNPGFPLIRRSTQGVDELPIPGAAGERSKLGERYARLMFNTSGWAKTTANETDFFTLAGSIGRHQGMVYYLNDGDSSHVYVCRRSEDIDLAQGGPNHYQFGPLAFEET